MPILGSKIKIGKLTVTVNCRTCAYGHFESFGNCLGCVDPANWAADPQKVEVKNWVLGINQGLALWPRRFKL